MCGTCNDGCIDLGSPERGGIHTSLLDLGPLQRRRKMIRVTILALVVLIGSALYVDQPAQATSCNLSEVQAVFVARRTPLRTVFRRGIERRQARRAGRRERRASRQASCSVASCSSPQASCSTPAVVLRTIPRRVVAVVVPSARTYPTCTNGMCSQ